MNVDNDIIFIDIENSSTLYFWSPNRTFSTTARRRDRVFIFSCRPRIENRFDSITKSKCFRPATHGFPSPFGQTIHAVVPQYRRTIGNPNEHCYSVVTSGTRSFSYFYPVVMVLYRSSVRRRQRQQQQQQRRENRAFMVILYFSAHTNIF